MQLQAYMGTLEDRINDLLVEVKMQNSEIADLKAMLIEALLMIEGAATPPPPLTQSSA